MWDNPLVLVAVLALVVLVAAVVWTLAQVRRTLQRVDDMIINTERELTPLLANLRESSEIIRTSVVDLQEGIYRAEGFLEAIGEVGDSLRSVNNFLRSGTSQYLSQGMALWSGFQAFRSFFKRSKERKEHSHGRGKE